jgi:hypothetical protein
MLRHLSALIVGHRQAALGVNPVQHVAETLYSRLSATISHFCQGHKQADSLNERTNSGGVATTFDQVALPVTRNHPFINLGWSLANADPVRKYATSTFTTCKWAAHFTRLPPRYWCLSALPLFSQALFHHAYAISKVALP